MTNCDALPPWSQLKQLVADALALAPHERAAHVQQVCGNNTLLKAELDSLLAAAEQTSQLDAGLSGVDLGPLEPTPPADLAGRMLGDYRLLALIARGGMGEVYRAERADGQYEKQVAVKVVREGADSGFLLQRFNAERRILAALDHPNLAKLLDAGIAADGAPFFVMELVDGTPIDTYCEHNRLALPERVALLRTVCLVVDYAHRQGVIHRDLKPSNVLVTHDGVVKLVDFGIAKRLLPLAEEDATRTATALRALTPEYASPEQVRGETVTPASDIYSLGVLLYRLLTGASPYAGVALDRYSLTRAICETEPEPPSRALQTAPRLLKRQLQGDLDAVALMALRKEPQRRYSSAEALADDLFRHLEGLPVQARRGAWSYRAGRFMLRHRTAAVAALLANIALVVGISVATYQAVEAHRQRDRAERYFASVRKLANAMMGDMHDAIRVLPGSTPARKLLVDNALKYLEGLSTEARDDKALQIELASGYRAIGDIQGRPGGSNLGDPQGAQQSYSRAAALLKPVVAQAGQRDANLLHDAQQELVTVYQRQGALMGFTGKVEEALTVLQTGVALADELAAADSNHRKRQLMRAGIYGQLGQVQMFAGKIDEFLKTSATASRLLEVVVATDPNDTIASMTLAANESTRGEYFIQHDLDKESARLSLESHRKATALRERLYATQPDNAVVARPLAIGFDDQALALLRLGQPRQAAEHSRRALEILSVLAAKNPSDPLFRADAARVQGSLSEALLAVGDVAASVAAASAAVAAYEALPDGARAETYILYRQALSYHQLGRALDQQSQLPARTIAAASADHRAACARERQALKLFASPNEGDDGPPSRSFVPAAREALRRCA